MAHEIRDEIRLFAEQLLEWSELELEATVEPNQDQVVVDLSGPDTDLVLTENARLLHALNHPVSQIFTARRRVSTGSWWIVGDIVLPALANWSYWLARRLSTHRDQVARFTSNPCRPPTDGSSISLWRTRVRSGRRAMGVGCIVGLSSFPKPETPFHSIR